MSHGFDEMKKLEDEYVPTVKADLKRVFGLSFRDVRTGQSVDFEGGKCLVELKVRKASFVKKRDILLETVSKVEKGRPGWLLTSKADFLYYLYATQRPLRAILNMPYLKEWAVKDLLPRPWLWKEDGTTTKEGWSTVFITVSWNIIPSYVYFRRFEEVEKIDDSHNMKHV